MPAFQDSRTPAELLLAPRVPVSRSVVNFSTLRLGLDGPDLPGVISKSAQIAGPLRQALGGSLQSKAEQQQVAANISSVLSGYDAQAAALKAGTFIPPDPLLAPASAGVPNVASFFSFSSLAPGAPIPSNFDAIIAKRKTQLQQLERNFSAVNAKTTFGGVSLTENTTPQPYPLDSQIDIPSVPRLAQGGAVAKDDPIYKDKVAFAVHGVPIGSGKPSAWTRLVGGIGVAIPPNLNSQVGQLFRDRKKQSTWSEPVTAYNAQFPYNRVQQSASGHVIEIDDTPGAERVHIFHRSGSFIEFHPDGSIVYKSMKDGYCISLADQYVKVNGKCHVAVDGGVTLYSKGNIDIQADGDINFQAKGNFNVFAKNIHNRAKQIFKADGTSIDLRYIKLPTGLGIILPMGGGPYFVPRVNMTAVSADLPNGNFEDAATFVPTMDASAGGPAIVPGASPAGPPIENPLSNFSIYESVVPAAVAYRSKLFDTPEEVNDFEMYSAHTGLQTALKDTTTSSRELGGGLSTLDTGLVAPATKPAVDFLDYNNFKGTYAYANTFAPGGTSFTLTDLCDVALHDFVKDTTLTDAYEDTPEDLTNFAGAVGAPPNFDDPTLPNQDYAQTYDQSIP